MFCIFCSDCCEGSCSEWNMLETMMNEIIEYTENNNKKKRKYKTQVEMLQSDYVSLKCFNCRLSRKSCNGSPFHECSRCVRSKKKQCVFDDRFFYYGKRMKKLTSQNK